MTHFVPAEYAVVNALSIVTVVLDIDIILNCSLNGSFPPRPVGWSVPVGKRRTVPTIEDGNALFVVTVVAPLDPVMVYVRAAVSVPAHRNVRGRRR
tara:strand:+ start:988 stop:1275 length:288 start_codon:yes stop_codon:yes gene_type:complete